jgi:hypothetical protein
VPMSESPPAGPPRPPLSEADKQLAWSVAIAGVLALAAWAVYVFSPMIFPRRVRVPQTAPVGKLVTIKQYTQTLEFRDETGQRDAHPFSCLPHIRLHRRFAVPDSFDPSRHRVKSTPDGLFDPWRFTWQLTQPRLYIRALGAPPGGVYGPMLCPELAWHC